MTAEESQFEILKLLADHEEALNQLYQVYAERFPEDRALWSKLAAEELDHARMVQNVMDKVKAGKLEYKKSRFKKEALQTSLKFLRDELAKARNRAKEMSAIYALSIAVNLENAIIDNKFFEIMEGDVKDLKSIMQSTYLHRSIVQKAWSDKKSSKH